MSNLRNILPFIGSVGKHILGKWVIYHIVVLL